MGSKSEILEIFPNEVWEEILSHVNTAADYQKISNASPQFRTLLLSRTPELLFPEVVKPYVECQGNDVSSWTPLRGACRAWKQAVDHELQREESYSRKELREAEAGTAVIATTFKTTEDITKFEEHFDSSHLDKANPLLSRAIRSRVKWKDYEDKPLGSFYSACHHILRKYGEYVWSCEIEELISAQPGFEPPDFATCFYEWELAQILRLMPNLRSLQLTTRFRLDDEMEALECGSKYYRTRNPFPTLEHLSQIRFGDVPHPVVSRFLEQNRQISKVDATWGLHCYVGVYLKWLHNLSALAFRPEDEYELKCLSEFQSSCQTVEHLGINARWVKGLSWQKIFDTLETCFGSNLTQLCLALPPANESTESGTTLSLKLPKLKKLKLELKAGQPLDFIMPMKDTLEQLSLEIVENEKEKVVQKAEVGSIRLFEVWNQPHKSNMWTLFSKLGLIETWLSLGGLRNSCTRAEWKEWGKTSLGQVDLTQLNLKSD